MKLLIVSIVIMCIGCASNSAETINNSKKYEQECTRMNRCYQPGDTIWYSKVRERSPDCPTFPRGSIPDKLHNHSIR